MTSIQKGESGLETGGQQQFGMERRTSQYVRNSGILQQAENLETGY